MLADVIIEICKYLDRKSALSIFNQSMTISIIGWCMRPETGQFVAHPQDITALLSFGPSHSVSVNLSLYVHVIS